jgi:flagellin
MIERLNNASGVLAALRSLQGASDQLTTTTNRVSSGLAVANPSDDATKYHTAALMRGETNALKVVTLSLGRAQSISDTSISSAEQISKLLTEMKKTATSAAAGGLTATQAAVLNDQFQEQLEQINTFIRNSAFDDANMLDGSRPAGVTFVADAAAEQTLTLKGRDLSPGGAIITVDSSDTLLSTQGATAAIARIDASIEALGRELTDMSTENKQITAQIGFVGRLADALAAGVGRLVDADMAVESALMQALQIKQQLSSQSINVANSAPESLLQLFKS